MKQTKDIYLERISVENNIPNECLKQFMEIANGDNKRIQNCNPLNHSGIIV